MLQHFQKMLVNIFVKMFFFDGNGRGGPYPYFCIIYKGYVHFTSPHAQNKKIVTRDYSTNNFLTRLTQGLTLRVTLFNSEENSPPAVERQRSTLQK
jgi:hypothetical protein